MKRAPKTVLPAGKSDGGASAPIARAARGVNKGKANTGPGRDRQNPKAQRNRKIEAWCEGKGNL
jgi:hypothetical protein